MAAALPSHEIDVDTCDSTSTPRDSLEISHPLLLKWRSVAKKNKRLHEAARAHFKRLADIGALSAIALASVGGFVNILLGVADVEYVNTVNIAQVVIGVTGLASAGVVSASKQLAWETKHERHESYVAMYGEVVRMINSEETLVKLNDSSYSSRGEFIKAVKAELDRIEDHSPPIPGFLETKLGMKSSHTNGD